MKRSNTERIYSCLSMCGRENVSHIDISFPSLSSRDINKYHIFTTLCQVAVLNDTFLIRVILQLSKGDLEKLLDADLRK